MHRLSHGNGDSREGRVAAVYRNQASERLQRLGGRRFIPHVKHIPAGRNADNRVMSCFVRRGEELRTDGKNYAGHFRVNVAEQIGRAGPVEANGFLRSRLVETKIESFSLI